MQQVINLWNSFPQEAAEVEIFNHFPKGLVKFMSDWFLMDYQSLLGSNSLNFKVEVLENRDPYYNTSVCTSVISKIITLYISPSWFPVTMQLENHYKKTLWTRKDQPKAPVPWLLLMGSQQILPVHHSTICCWVQQHDGSRLFPSRVTPWPSSIDPHLFTEGENKAQGVGEISSRCFAPPSHFHLFCIPLNPLAKPYCMRIQ